MRTGAASAIGKATLACLILSLATSGAEAQSRNSSQVAQPAAEQPAVEQPAAVAPAVEPQADEAPAPSASELRMQAYSLFPGGSGDKAKAIDLFKQAAEAGDAESMAFLGSIYLSGDGVEADREVAVSWYVKAAHAGNVGAISKLAELAAVQAPVAEAPAAKAEPAAVEPTEDMVEAPSVVASEEAAGIRTEALALIDDGQTTDGFAMMEEAAKAGDIRAMGALGNLYLAGVGTTRSKASAQEWLGKAAEAGDVISMLHLADLLRAGGVGVTRDEARADALMRDARVSIEQMDFAADGDQVLEIAEMLAASSEEDTKDYGHGLLRRLARAGSTDAMMSLASLAPTFQEQADWLEPAAEAGDASAMQQLGDAYANGRGRDVDYDLAIEWLQRAADAGDAVAAEQIAVVEELASASSIETRIQEAIDTYIGGSMTEEQYDSVVATFEEGIAADHLESKYWLADMLLAGDWEDAERGFTLMNEYVDAGGDEFGMAAIARAYESGNGTERSLPSALEWFQRAVDNGYAAEADVARVADLVARTPPLPTASFPPSDRWGPFLLDGDYAMGISAGNAYFAFGCYDGSLYVEFNPGEEINPKIEGLDEVWVVLMDSKGKAMAYAQESSYRFFTFDDGITKDWMSLAAAANGLSLGVTDDLNEWKEYTLYNVTDFSARGSSAAIQELRNICTTVQSL